MHPARIQDGRVVIVCRACAGQRSFAEAPRMVACAFCDAEIPAWTARHLVLGGRLQARCAACARIDAEPPPVEIAVEVTPPPIAHPEELPSKPRRSHRLRVVAVAAGVAVGATLYTWIGRGSTLEGAAAASVLAPPAPRAVVVPLFLPAPIAAAPRPAPAA